MTPTDGGGPDKEWFAGDNTHLRGITEMGVITGNLEGMYSVMGNYHLNLSTGEGQSFGKGMFMLTNGTFEGNYVGKVSFFGESITIWVVAHGTSEDVEGMKLIGTAIWSSGQYTYEGYILDPHGE
jgi:hypothetical protein